MVHQGRLLQTFFRLVQIDSETTCEAEMAAELKLIFNDLGLEIAEDNAAQETGHTANNLIVTLPGSDPSADMIHFTAHMDTASPGQNIQPVLYDDKITSDAATVLGADDKAGIAAMIEVVKLLQASSITHGMIQFILTIGEEAGLKGSSVLDTSLIKATYGYALDSEGSVGHIVSTSPSQAQLQVVIGGAHDTSRVTVHQRQQGISSIRLASRLISQLPLGKIDQETTVYIDQFHGEPFLGHEGYDIVFLVNVTATHDDRLYQYMNNIRTMIMQTAATLGGAVDVSVGMVVPAYTHPEDSCVIQTAKRAFGHMNMLPTYGCSDGGSDANHLSKKGIPTVNLAVGYENPHTTHESMTISALEQTTEMLMHIIHEAKQSPYR